jgi:hypothetical protein
MASRGHLTRHGSYGLTEAGRLEAGGGAARAETLALAVYDAGAGVAEARRVGQGVASNGAAPRPARCAGRCVWQQAGIQMSGY